MDIKLFDYHLPSGYIAQEPLVNRDQSKLMILDKNSGIIQHRKFYQIVDFLQPGDLLLLNNSKVLPVRLYGHKTGTGGKIEALLIRPISDTEWKVLLKPGKRVHEGTEIFFAPELKAVVIGKDTAEGIYRIHIQARGNFYQILQKIGTMPTPPYIKKGLDNSTQYQTVYASEEGSIAAPTAGFHFTRSLLKLVEEKGIKILFLTLHIGRGTFEMVRTERVEKHAMKPELYTITPEIARSINRALQSNRRIVGVGTSVTRALESSVHENKVQPGTYWTDLFIYPGYQFRIVQALITNFHLPRSTPLLLASALAGKDRLLNAYQEAILENYRFYSFGDAMFIL